MKSKMNRLLVAVFGTALLACLAANAATIKWQPVNGDWSGDFGNVNHWEGGAVPGASDVAMFPAASSPKAFTVTVNANYSIGSMNVEHYDSSGRKVTFSGTGKITASQSGQVNYIGRYDHAVFDGVSFQSAGESLHYGTVEILTGSTFTYSRNFYLWEPDATIVVDGGTCSFQQIVCSGCSTRGRMFPPMGLINPHPYMG